jgi:hypothetical protein
MRLLVSFMIVFAALMCLQTVRPHCSMTDLLGVEWLGCLFAADQRNRDLSSPPVAWQYIFQPTRLD